MSKYSRNDGPTNQQPAAQLYHRLRQLHLEIANVYGELASIDPHVDSIDKVVPIRSKSGKLLANLLPMNGKTRVEIASCLRTDNAPCTWLKSHLKSVAKKDETLRFNFDEKDSILKSIEIEGNITLDFARKLESALRWAFDRMGADGNAASNEAGSACRDDRTQTRGHVSKKESWSNG